MKPLLLFILLITQTVWGALPTTSNTNQFGTNAPLSVKDGAVVTNLTGSFLGNGNGLTNLNGGQLVGNILNSTSGVVKVLKSGSAYNDATGALQIVNTASPSEFIFIGYDANLGASGSGYIQSIKNDTGYTPLLLNPNGGYVGVGTTTAAFPLNIRGSVSADADTTITGSLFGLTDSANTHGLYVRVKDAAVGISGLGYASQLIAYGGNAFEIFAASFMPIVFGIGGLEKARIDAAGKLGIGTTAPTSALHVVGLPVFANNAAAITGGLSAGAFYRTGADPDPVCVVH